MEMNILEKLRDKNWSEKSDVSQGISQKISVYSYIHGILLLAIETSSFYVFSEDGGFSLLCDGVAMWSYVLVG